MDRKDQVIVLGLVIRLLIFAAIMLTLSSCADKGLVDLTARQQAIQDCITSGGHPHLGPDNTVVCEH